MLHYKSERNQTTTTRRAALKSKDSEPNSAEKEQKYNSVPALRPHAKMDKR